VNDGQVFRELTLPVRETLGLFFGNPRRVSHQAAKVPAVETGILIGHYVGEAGALGGLRPMLQAVVKGLQKVFRKSRWMRKSRFDSLALRIGEFVIAEAHQVHHYPFGSKCGDGVQMRGDSRRRVQRNRQPDFLDINFRNAMAPQEFSCGVRTIHLEAQTAFPEAGCQADIMEHGCRVEKLRIKSQPPTLSRQEAPKIDARGVLKQKVTLGIPNELRCFARQLAVGNCYAVNIAIDHGRD
jgi:hypothetical protein